MKHKDNIKNKIKYNETISSQKRNSNSSKHTVDPVASCIVSILTGHGVYNDSKYE